MESSMDGGALELNNGAEGTVKRMTDAEAQAVIELWAQRRKAEEVEATMPSAKELSEALNVSQSEVEALLLEVRRSKEPSVAPESESKTSFWGGKTSRNRIWAVAIISILLATVVYAFVVSAMKPDIVPFAPTPIPVAEIPPSGTTEIAPPADTVVVADPAPADVILLPTKLRVEFDGLVLQSSRPWNNLSTTSDSHIQETVERSIRQFVRQASQVPLGGENLIVDSEKLVDALINDKAEYSDFFIWRTLILRHGESQVGYQIPICVNVQERVKEAVTLEQNRRIAKASSQAVEMVRGRYVPR